jgi:hypothetical protein
LITISGGKFDRTISVNINSGSTRQEQLHDFQRSGLCAIVQGRVALDGLSVDIGLLLHKILGDFVVAFVAGDHQASVAVTISDFDVWKEYKTDFLI